MWVQNFYSAPFNNMENWLFRSNPVTNKSDFQSNYFDNDNEILRKGGITSLIILFVKHTSFITKAIIIKALYFYSANSHFLP